MSEAIPTQDLEAHHHPLRGELEAAALRVIASGRFILGPEVAALEQEVARAAGARSAVGVSSGTDALLAILMALGIGPGDEVVTTPFTFFATVGAIARVGARPVFADIDPLTFNLEPALAAERLGPRAKAAITVHLFGRMAETGPLGEACRARSATLIEDAAQAIGANAEVGGRVVPVGSLGRATALSFFPSKNLGGFGDGGMVLAADQELDERLRLVRTHGSARKYHHAIVGGNFRLDEMQAALLRVKLPHLPRWSAERRRVAARYHSVLADLPVQRPPRDPGCVWNQYVVRVPDGRRDALAAHLTASKIASAVYYPEPLHLQPCFRELGYKLGDFPNAEKACAEVLALPIYPELPDPAVDRVAEVVRAFFQR
jgi:dTDP-4-amino-4,6-dideoxygalactose transaminase